MSQPPGATFHPEESTDQVDQLKAERLKTWTKEHFIALQDKQREQEAEESQAVGREVTKSTWAAESEV